MNLAVQSWDAWADALSRLAYIPVAYSGAEIAYQAAYHGKEAEFTVLENGGSAVGVMTGAPLFFPGVSRAVQKGVIGHIKPVKPVSCSESFSNAQGLSVWHDAMLKAGFSVSVRHDLFIDLSLPLDEIKSRFSKGHRAAVTAAGRLWTAHIMDFPEYAIWDDFRALHRESAGRETRPESTWAMQCSAITAGNAFLAYLQDSQGAFAGAGYFAITRDEGAYNVGAYDRSRFAQPVGHLVQWAAIQEMKRRGLRWYKIGSRPYVADNPSEKELRIAEFKQGFATHLFPKYVFTR